MFHRKTITASLEASTPVFFGYISIGMVFGFLLVKEGFNWLLAPIMSITIFAGAAQYLAIDLISNNIPLLEIGLTILLLNARHIVYGLSLLDRFKAPSRHKGYLIFGLTDETYGLLTTIKPPKGTKPEYFDLWITLLNQSYWVIGSIIGAIIGNIIPVEIEGLDFALTALFIVLTIEQIKQIKRFEPFLYPVVIFALLSIIGAGSYLLILTIVLSSVSMIFIKEKR